MEKGPDPKTSMVVLEELDGGDDVTTLLCSYGEARAAMRLSVLRLC